VAEAVASSPGLSAEVKDMARGLSAEAVGIHGGRCAGIG